MDIITLGDKRFAKYISNEEIQNSIDKMASQIDEDYKDSKPVFLVTLNGALFFAVDLLRKLKVETYITCIKLSSYCGITSTLQIKDQIGLSEKLEGKRVIILEDIVDTGATYEHIINLLNQENVHDIRMATLTLKPDAYQKVHPIHYVGFSIPNKFIVGYGLDYDGLGRNLSDIYQIITE